MRVGVIGAGTIASNYLAAGQSVIVYNRTRARGDELRALGAEVAGSVGQICGRDAVIRSMPLIGPENGR
jgi:3-hydroxyisobutyrate dehydrogenase-like beta-hydroxyacid dehydrogenase